MMRAFVTLLLALAALLGARSASAHKPSDAYVSIDASSAVLQVRVDVALRDLQPVLGLDADGDGALSWREVDGRSSDLVAYVVERFTLATESAPCPLAPSPGSRLELVGHTDGTYAVLRFDARCPTTPRTLRVQYRLLFDRDALHRGLVRVVGAGPPKTAIFSAESTSAAIALEPGASSGNFLTAIREGVIHIAEGTDHLLFVLALLLPSVLRRAPGSAAGSSSGPFGSWVPVADFRTALLDVLRIVTAFTIAHSITLSLAALDVVRLPSRLVETSIALSVVVAAANNIRPFLGAERWFAAFALGLLHGFGFSAVLADLGLARAELAQTLVGFNCGVEIGQLAFVSLVFPIAFALRRSRVYVPVALRGASAIIAAVALVWAIERAFDVRVFG
jgi:hypothetical protein